MSSKSSVAALLVVTSCSTEVAYLLIVSDRFRFYYRIIYSLVVPIQGSGQSRTTQRIPLNDDRVRDGDKIIDEVSV